MRGRRWAKKNAGAKHNVHQDPDCQPRRDRLPHHQDRAPHGHRDRRRLLGGGPRRPACRACRRSRLHRSAGLARLVSRQGQDHRRVQGDGRPGRASRLRVPVRERGVRARPRGRRHRVHRAEARVDRGDGRQDRVQEARGQGQRQHDPRLYRRHSRCGERRAHRARRRLSGDDQGVRRRRRQGPARRAQRPRGARGLRRLSRRGQGELRRRPHLHREIHRGAAAHRDPGAGRCAREPGLPVGARVLDPASPPEGHRGGAVAVPRRRRRGARWASRRSRSRAR